MFLSSIGEYFRGDDAVQVRLRLQQGRARHPRRARGRHEGGPGGRGPPRRGGVRGRTARTAGIPLRSARPREESEVRQRKNG